MSNVKFKFANVHFDQNANFGNGEYKARFVRFDKDHADAEGQLQALSSENGRAFLKAREGIVDWSLKQVEDNIEKIKHSAQHAETLAELSRAKAVLKAKADPASTPSKSFGKPRAVQHVTRKPQAAGMIA